MKTITTPFVLSLVCVLILACSSPSHAEPSEQLERPNIVLIMIDDIGAESVGVYGSQSTQTPRMDQLAKSGIRFDNCYASPACTPSRVQLLTGKYPHRTGWSGFINLKASPDNNDYLNPKEGSFAKQLQSLGYSTAIAGKWQLARLDKRPDHLQQLGFDEHCMWTWIYDDQYQPRYWKPKIVQNGELIATGKKDYGPDITTHFLLDFIERNQDNPFFVYYPMLLVHTGFHPTSDFDGDAQAELKAIKREDQAGKNTKGYKNVSKSKEGAARYFPAMVATADTRIGRMIDKLDELSLRENTVVLITGDNGSPYQVVTEYRDENGTLRIKGGKQNLGETGCRVPLIVNWPGKAPEHQVLEDLVDFSDFFPTILEIAGRHTTSDETDGHSYASQIIGKPASHPRKWVHSAFKDKRFVRDRRFMLYADGRLLDLKDRYRPRQAKITDSVEAGKAYQRLKSVLDAMPKDADRYRWEE